MSAASAKPLQQLEAVSRNGFVGTLHGTSHGITAPSWRAPSKVWTVAEAQLDNEDSVGIVSVDVENAVPAVCHTDKILVVAHDKLNVLPHLSVMLKAGSQQVEHRHANVSTDDPGAVRLFQLPEQYNSDLHSFLSSTDEILPPVDDLDDIHLDFHVERWKWSSQPYTTFIMSANKINAVSGLEAATLTVPARAIRSFR